jgi:hypothetical protein
MNREDGLVSPNAVALAAVISSSALGAFGIVFAFGQGALDRRHALRVNFTDRQQDRREATYLALGQYIFKIDGQLADLSNGISPRQPLELTPEYYRERDAMATRINYLASPHVCACWQVWRESTQRILDHRASATPAELRVDYAAASSARDLVTGQVRHELGSGYLGSAFEPPRWWHRVPGFRRRHKPPPAQIRDLIDSNRAEHGADG